MIIMKNDVISRQAAIDEVRANYDGILDFKSTGRTVADSIEDIINALPPAQPEITDVQAIEHLQDSGWMKNHDKQMYEMGLRKQLADDSDSYDALLPSAQPDWNEMVVICDCCGHAIQVKRQ